MWQGWPGHYHGTDSIQPAEKLQVYGHFPISSESGTQPSYLWNTEFRGARYATNRCVNYKAAHEHFHPDFAGMQKMWGTSTPTGK